MEKVINVCPVSQSHVPAVVNSIGQNLLKLLRENSRLKTVAVEFVVVGERRVVLIFNDSHLIDVLKLILGVQLADVVLHTFVARLNDVPGNLNVAVHHETLVGHVVVDSDFSLVEYRVLCDSALPAAQVDVTLKLAGVGSPHNDSLTCVTDDGIISGVGVRVQANNQLKVSLLRVGSALLPHVVTSCFREVETPNCDLSHLTVLQVDSVGRKVC